jgi:AAA+ superfamily predicted ATPase
LPRAAIDYFVIFYVTDERWAIGINNKQLGKYQVMRKSSLERENCSGGRIAKLHSGGADTGEVDAVGVLDSRMLPNSEFIALWDAVIVEASQKDRLLSQAILNFTLREKVNRANLPLHGLIVLHGPPGTGKTSLARGLAARTAEAVGRLGQFRYIEVEPHALTGAALGKSQRAVRDLLGQTVAEQAERGPLIVLLDEVETLAADRGRMSMDANPIDVHRATDAVLAQLDQLAAKYPHLLFIATSNFTRAVDGAFLSRADLIENVGMPGPEACRAILQSALEELAGAFPATASILQDADFHSAAKQCVGLDGRRIRKLVFSACALNKQTAIDPNRLSASDVLQAAKQAQAMSLCMMGEQS